MGNRKCIPPKPMIPNMWKSQSKSELKPTISISNPSLVTIDEAENDFLETTPSQQFCEAYMDQIFQKFVAANGMPEKFPSEVLKAITNLIDTMSMDDNILFLSNKFADALDRYDDTYSAYFSACAERNPLKSHEYSYYSTDHRITLHIMFYLRTQRIILTAFEDGKDEKAHEILNLIALSHIIMKITPEYFKMLTVSTIKNLLHYSLIPEEHIPPFVYFNERLNNFICQAMESYKQKHRSHLLHMTETNAPAREYYRELKKWKAFVASLNKSLNKPIIQLDRQIEDENKQEGFTGLGDEEKWKIIRMLKKGYKYRYKDDGELKFF